MKRIYFNAISLSLIFISISVFLYPQNAVIYNNKIYDIGITEKDVVIKRINRQNYELNIKYKKDIASVMLCLKYKDGSMKELYYMEEGMKKYVYSDKPSEGDTFAESFRIMLPNDLFIENTQNESVKLDNMPYDIAVKSVSYNKDVFQYNILKEKILPPKFTKPSLEMSSLSQTYNTYTVYVKYSGGYEKPIAFYYREGNMSTEYKYIPMMWSFDKDDAVGIKISDTYINDIGKEMVVKLFFQMKQEDRYIYINAFDNKGITETIPLEIILKGNGISENSKPSVSEIPIANSSSERKETNNKTERKAIPNIQKPDKRDIEPKPYVNILPKTIGQNENRENDTKPRIYSGTIDRDIKEIKSADDLSLEINSIVTANKDISLDLVFVFDATGSMKDALKNLQKNIGSILDNIYINYEPDKIRTGFVFFKDSRDEYLTKTIAYSRNRNYIERVIQSVRVSGGGDVPEPILEAIDTALNDFSFEASKKMIIVITDAPSKESLYLTKDILLNRMSDSGIRLEYLKLPQAEEQ